MNSENFLIFLIIIILTGFVGFAIYAKYRRKIDNKTVYIIIGLLLTVVICFTLYMMYKKRKSSPGISSGNYPDTSFSKINEFLDTEHTGIFDALDNFYNKAIQHWNSEKKLFQEGQAKLPSGHPDITGMWQEHEQHHTELIDRIIQMKKDIITHIENYDKPQFHWV